jgi:hypothetical protein
VLRSGDFLRIEAKVRPSHASEDVVHADALALARTLLTQLPDWGGLQVAFLRRWRDSFGAVEDKPWIVASLERRIFERLVLENLTPAEVFGHFQVERPVHEGFVLWDR